MEKEYTIESIGHIAVLYLRGRITIGDGDVRLSSTVNFLLGKGVRHILISLRRVTFMDAAGIGTLVACQNQARAHRAVIKLLNPSAKVHDLLSLTKLDEVFEVYQDMEEALVSLAASQHGDAPTAA